MKAPAYSNIPMPAIETKRPRVRAKDGRPVKTFLPGLGDTKGCGPCPGYTEIPVGGCEGVSQYLRAGRYVGTAAKQKGKVHFRGACPGLIVEGATLKAVLLMLEGSRAHA